MNSSEKPSENWKEKAVLHAEQQGKITNGFALLSMDRFGEQLEEQAANQRAENEAFRRQFSDSPGGDSSPEDDSMHQIVLGDYTENHPAPQPKRLLASGLIAAVATAGILGPVGIAGGYFLNELLKDDKVSVPVPAPVVPGEDETADLKLGRIENYTE